MSGCGVEIRGDFHLRASGLGSVEVCCAGCCERSEREFRAGFRSREHARGIQVGCDGQGVAARYSCGESDCWVGWGCRAWKGTGSYQRNLQCWRSGQQ